MDEHSIEVERVEGFALENYLDFEIYEEDGFFYDREDDSVVGAVVEYLEYPTEEERLEHFDQILFEAIQATQDCRDEVAQEILEEIDENGEEELPQYDIAERFSLFFTVDGHEGLYRMLMDGGECWVGHSSGARNARWSF